MRTAAAAILVCLSGITTAKAQTTQPVKVHLDWERADNAKTCAGAQAIVSAVEERLGRRLFASLAEADLNAWGQVKRIGKEEWTAELRLRTAYGRSLGERRLSLRGVDCSALDQAVVLTLSLMLDVKGPGDTQDTAESESSLDPADERAIQDNAEQSPKQAEPPPTEPIAETKTQPESLLPSQAATPHSFRPLVSLSAAVGLGMLPGIGIGGQLHGAVSPRYFWRSELEVGFWLTRDSRISSAGASFFRADLGLFLCPFEHWRGRLGYALCFGSRVGRLEAKGLGFAPSERSLEMVVDAGAKTRLVLQLSRPWVLTLGAEVLTPLVRTSYFYLRADEQPMELFRMAPVAGVFDLGLGLLFGS